MNTQKAQKSAARKQKQAARGSVKFANKSNKHHGASISQSGQKKR